MKMNKAKNKIKIEQIVISIIVLVLASYYYTVLVKDYEVVPKKVQSELSFKPVVAGAQKSIGQPNDFEIGLNGSLLTYQQEYENKILNVSQRTIPDEVKDFPERYDQFIETISPQSSVEAGSTIYYLSSDGIKQTAIAKLDNLLIFVTTDGQLTGEQWQKFLNELKPV